MNLNDSSCSIIFSFFNLLTKSLKNITSNLFLAISKKSNSSIVESADFSSNMPLIVSIKELVISIIVILFLFSQEIFINFLSNFFKLSVPKYSSIISLYFLDSSSFLIEINKSFSSLSISTSNFSATN